MVDLHNMLFCPQIEINEKIKEEYLPYISNFVAQFQNLNNCTNLWLPLITITCHVVGYVGWWSSPRVTKMTVSTLPFNIETCNRNQTPLKVWVIFQLKHAIGHAGWQPSHGIIKMATMTLMPPQFSTAKCGIPPFGWFLDGFGKVGSHPISVCIRHYHIFVSENVITVTARSVNFFTLQAAER